MTRTNRARHNSKRNSKALETDRKVKRDPELEQKRLKRAVALFDYFDLLRENANSAKRIQLAEKTWKQRVAIDARNDQIRRHQEQRDEREAKLRRKYLVDKQSKLCAISNKVVPSHTVVSQKGHAENQERNGLDLDPPSLLDDSSSSKRPHIHRRMKSRQPRHHPPIFRGAAYHAQAQDLKAIRSELVTPKTPVNQRYTPSASTRQNINLKNISARVDAKRPKQFQAFQAIPKVRRRIIPREAVVNKERDSAMEAVFKTRTGYEEFKRRYENVPPQNRPNRSAQEHERVSQPAHDARLASKRLMYNTAARNRQRTLTFAQSGGTTGVAAQAAPASGHRVAPTSLEAFATHLLHGVTDADMGKEYLDSTALEEDSSEPSDSEGTTAKLDRYATEGYNRDRNEPKIRSGRASITSRSRPASALAFGSPDEQRRRSVINAATRQKLESKGGSHSHSRRSSLGTRQDLALADERLATGRRGPSAAPRSSSFHQELVPRKESIAEASQNEISIPVIDSSLKQVETQQKVAEPVSTQRRKSSVPLAKILSFGALVRAAVQAKEKSRVPEETEKAEEIGEMVLSGSPQLGSAQNVDYLTQETDERKGFDSEISDQNKSENQTEILLPESRGSTKAISSRNLSTNSLCAEDVPSSRSRSGGSARSRSTTSGLEDSEPFGNIADDNTLEELTPSAASYVIDLPVSRNYTMTSPPCADSLRDLPPLVNVKAERIRKYWEPISVTAAAETRKSIIPRKFLKLPRSAAAAEIPWQPSPIESNLWDNPSIARISPDSTRPVLLPQVLKFWSGLK
ncbi:hypothetical protein DFS34DRAFT_692149 [Phlyctochytrium arcticum]|nr:hypothetical protein DFS34DRAFT_692149 [Phlyctochytrium arcticum]